MKNDDEKINTDEVDDEDTETFQMITELCESNPDKGLEFIRDAIEKNPVLESYIFLKFCRARAFHIKGVQPLIDRQIMKIHNIETKMLHSYLNNENLNYLEASLLEIRKIEDIDPGFMRSHIETQIDSIAHVLERCRPGKVQQILGITKIGYFGFDRVQITPEVEKELPSEKLKLFLYIPFNFPFIIKSAFILFTGKNNLGHRYINCMLFDKIFDDFKKGETYGDAEIGEITLVDDGTFTYTLNREYKNSTND